MTRSGFPGGPNYVLREDDFPFHEKADAADRDSPALFDSDDVVGSQGVLNAEFHSLGLGGRTRIGEDPADAVRLRAGRGWRLQRRRRRALAHPCAPRDSLAARRP